MIYEGIGPRILYNPTKILSFKLGRVLFLLYIPKKKKRKKEGKSLLKRAAFFLKLPEPVI